MAHKIAIALLALTVAAVPPDGKDPAPAGGKAEVMFADGSTVKAVIPEQDLAVQTKYGRLVVPARDVVRIEVGLRPDGALAAMIREAIKRIGSAAYGEREAATRELIGLGGLALPALEAAARSPEPEVAERARLAIARIHESLPADAPRATEDDRVHTPGFIVVGRIVGPVLKSRTAYFGEMDLKLGDLRGIRFAGPEGLFEATVDAARFGSGPDQWLETDAVVQAGARLEVTASGQVDLWNDGTKQYATGPAGYKSYSAGPGALIPGMLVGRIGPNGPVFAIGERYDGVPAGEGRLRLHIVPSPWNNPSTGSYTVGIRTGP